MTLAIGLVGEIGAGKGMFVQLLQEVAAGKKVERMASSSILGDTLDLWDIRRTRKALQDLAIIMNKHYGEGTLTHAAWKRITDSPADIVVFDGMRWKSDEEMIRRFPNNMIVYVTADEKIRYERITHRKEKEGESTTSFETFVADHKAHTELEISNIGKRADVVIQNNGTIEEYRKQVERMYEEKITNKK